MLRQTMRVQPAHTYVQKFLPPKTPAISFHVRAEIEFRDLALYGTIRALRGRQFKFCFLGDDRDFLSGVSTQKASNRTKMTAGTHDDFGIDLAIHNPVI